MNKMHAKYPKSRLILLCLAFLFAFLLVTAFRTSFHSIDAAVNLWIPTIRSQPLTVLAEGIATVFDTTSLVLISLLISSLLFFKGYKAHGLLLLGAMGGGALVVSIIKTLGYVARPTNAILPDTGFSYPSGHSAGCIIFVGVLAFFAWRHWHNRSIKIIVGIGLGAVAAVVGFDRVYLGVHWFSDVLGGWLFGAFWLSFVVLVFVWLERAGKFRSRRFAFTTNWLFVVAVVVSVLVISVNHLLFNV